MKELPSVSSQPKPPATEGEFPNGNAIDGRAYQMANPANPLQQLVIMSMESYMQMGTVAASQRGVMKSQDKRIKELLNQIAVCQLQLRDAQERLENLRAVRKSELRPEVEAALAAMTSSDLNYTAPKEG